ncbi:Uncharacterised protein [Dorea longicatena]|nr:Uncharacterised protein [Dorea longicatena]
MVDVLCTELDVVLRHGGVVKVHTRTPVTDTGVELGGVIVSVLLYETVVLQNSLLLNT